MQQATASELAKAWGNSMDEARGYEEVIRQLVLAEDAHNPLSDQEIVNLLRQSNIIIARRTVAKYREMLGLLSSSKRRRLSAAKKKLLA